jgi:hypothetical protein
MRGALQLGHASTFGSQATAAAAVGGCAGAFVGNELVGDVSVGKAIGPRSE